MPRLHSLCTAILRVGLLLAVAGLTGCLYANQSRDIDRNPVVDTGVGAAVIMPGQSAPAYPHPAPGSAAPVQTREEGGGVPGSAATSGSASGAEPAPSNIPLTTIGRSGIDEERSMSAHEESTWMKYLALPFAVLAAPFKAASKAARGEPEPGPPVPNTTPEPPQAEQRPAPVDYNTQRLQEMERELDRAQPSQPAPPPALPSSSVAGAAPSISDELAALQRLPQTPEPSRQVVPQPSESMLGAKPVQPLRGEAQLADGIVDRDEDGRVDMWIYRDHGQIVRKALDQNFDGRPDTTLHYDPESHQLARVDEDSDDDGAIDTWTDYRDGQVVRRRADADRDGTVDTWTFYRDGKITRHEQDTTGDGFRDRVGFYADGKLVREDRDSNGDGRPNIMNYYDAKERVSRREEDTDMDGVIDVISHYEKGRLARRELLSGPGTATR